VRPLETLHPKLAQAASLNVVGVLRPVLRWCRLAASSFPRARSAGLLRCRMCSAMATPAVALRPAARCPAAAVLGAEALRPFSSKLITTPFCGCSQYSARIRAAFASYSRSGLAFQVRVRWKRARHGQGSGRGELARPRSPAHAGTPQLCTRACRDGRRRPRRSSLRRQSRSGGAARGNEGATTRTHAG
jgi:hypothetical protein